MHIIGKGSSTGIHSPGNFLLTYATSEIFSVAIEKGILHNHILCLNHFNVRSFCFQSLQSLPNWIQLHMSGTSAICTLLQRINNKNTFFCYSLLLGQFQLKLFYCGKGCQNVASNVTLYPCERSHQNHLDD